VIGDILGGESEEIPLYPAWEDLVKFYRTLDEIIATKELPANQHDFLQQMEVRLANTMGCQEYFKGLDFELFTPK
jgi:hypothetical protein